MNDLPLFLIGLSFSLTVTAAVGEKSHYPDKAVSQVQTKPVLHHPVGVAKSALAKKSLPTLSPPAMLWSFSNQVPTTTVGVGDVPAHRWFDKVTLGKPWDRLSTFLNKPDRISALIPLRKYPELEDLVLWAEAQRDWVDFTTFKEAKKKSLIQRKLYLLEHAKASLLQIYHRFPHSPYFDVLPLEMAKIDFELGVIFKEKKLWIESRKAFERGIERLPNAKIAVYFSGSLLEEYLQACEILKWSSCILNLRKLADIYGAGTRELRLLRDKTSGVTGISVASLPERTTKTYKAPDLDAQAFDEVIPLLLKKENGKIQELLTTFLDKYPKSTLRPKVLYWLGRAQKNDGKTIESQQHWNTLVKESPLSFYALLVSLDGGVDPLHSLSKEDPLSTRWDPTVSVTDWIAIQRIELLIKAEQFTWAQIELDALNARRLGSVPLAFYRAFLNCRAQQYLHCYRLLGDLSQRGLNEGESDQAFELFYPFPFRDLIEDAASRNKLDPLLVLSLIKQESVFMPKILSGVGAVGLMQLMTYTASTLDSQVTSLELFQPRTNIQLGTRYLAELLQKFKGNVVFALAGYNAGPHRVDRWMKEFNSSGASWQEFIEFIPFRETRDYVGSILRNYYWYYYRIRGERLKSLDSFVNFNQAPAQGESPKSK